MKTIQFTGTLNQIENLLSLLDFPDNEMPKKSELLVYVVNVLDAVGSVSDESFVLKAKESGRVYTISEFQIALAFEEINTAIDEVRFINQLI